MKWLDDIFYYIKICSVWIMRIGYCRGFGIQSPTAYSFACNVVNDHRYYAAYGQLRRRMRHRGRTFQKLGRLLYRIARFQQPDVAIVDDADWAAYVRSGCEPCMVLVHDADKAESLQGKKSLSTGEHEEKTLWMLDASLMAEDAQRERVLDVCRDGDILVVYDIEKSNNSRRLWAQLVADRRTVVCFDLYYCGIVFFDKTKSKQLFHVNY